ncbi:MAG: T9SS type A sorting domain-containing protein [Bacteroidia bacterium]|nr:T9SS type A sorting domain-containing protein [Bacteroidota bacterium]MBP6412063.1 T9SS type A sorting domain-containing protein [Bacteroidia bacterium]
MVYLKRVILVISVFYYFHTKAQNLITNGDFENFSTCPNQLSQLYYANGWFQPHKYPGNHNVNAFCSTDFFYQCADSQSNVSVPANFIGFQSAHSGIGFMGGALFTPFFSGNGEREYAETKLTQTLIAGKKYNLNYFVSLSNKCGYSITKFDAYFSNDSLLYTSTDRMKIPVTPQIQYNGRINDTLNWVQISGSYVAIGGENFLTLGNFHDVTLCDSLTNPYFSPYPFAYYYYDDITLIEDTITAIDELGNSNFEIFPNPANASLQIKSLQLKKQVKIWNVYGSAVFNRACNSYLENIDVSNLENGVYIVECEFGNGMKQRRKIVVQH